MHVFFCGMSTMVAQGGISPQSSKLCSGSYTMNDSDVQYTSTGLMRKSVENLLISSHDVIGSSISPTLTFGAMTLPTNCPQGHVANSLEIRPPSPGASPQSSPRLSPRQNHKRDHSKGEISVGSCRDTSLLDKFEIIEDGLSRSSDSGHIHELSRSISHEGPSKERTKESGRGSDRTKKKSSWYNVLYPTYKSRSEDFKRIFKDVPSEERLIVDYSCALQKDILVHGRLYVSQNYLCFYANIFRWETSVSLRWKDVTAITKEKTALVIPNAILVCTEGEKLFFTSFGARDKTYLMLFRVWQNALMDQQLSMQEIWQWVHTCYGDELGLTSDDEDYIPPPNEEDKLSSISVRLSVDSFSEESCSMTESHMETTNTEEHQNDAPTAITTGMSVHSTSRQESYTGTILHSTSRTESTGHDRSSLQVPVSETLPTDMSDTTESEAEKQGTRGSSKLVACTSSHEGRKIIRIIVPIHVDLLFTMLFTNSKFYLDFHSARRTSDISHTPWQQDSETGTKQRVVTLTMPLSQSVGPKTTQVTEKQVMLPCSKPGELYAIDSDSVNSGIPYADSFYITSHYCMSRTADNESCLAVYAQIKYKKSVWGLIKSFIEKNTWSGLEDFYSHLQRVLLEEGTHLSVTKKKTRRRRRLMPVCATGSEEPKHRISRPAARFPLPELRSPADSLSWVVLAVLLFLVLLNALLYYKLWTLEEWTQDSSHSFTVMDLQVLRQPPKSHEEWLHLVQQQEALHNIEMQKWQKILQAAVQLLRQTEESLSELQVAINPMISKKVLSVLKDTFTEEIPKDEVESAASQPEVDQSTVPEGEL
ncbi:GRAM domain-containing protein 1B-like isoform X2 [Zootermopsis nevadensis]|uniref:GRAM domain-containing protein 1B-like isoform X2 n=1 Tax=Zootermopsis nevadensis TaxID=136037 RepID=UPI000B8E273E|nr:GRAM domain-containing protein 1B-like isoform X2 [Zootermopsis nevadensis]